MARITPVVAWTRNAVSVAEPSVCIQLTPHGRAGDAVALGVVLAAVAGAAEAGRLRRNQRHVLVRRLRDLLLLVEDRPVRLDGAAEMRAAVREDREARDGACEAVVAHVGG